MQCTRIKALRAAEIVPGAVAHVLSMSETVKVASIDEEAK